ncbi:hypothetical protein N9O93_00385 [bacterium]|nr:hypothetical protein [Hellea sp.]MDA9047920.1 hypothetical protein [Hellea sp.]MDA9225128.1 hypothetical protein [bacterium]
MKHMIKWLKISAAINIYLSLILTLVLVALIVDIGLDSYWHGADFKDAILEEIYEAKESTTDEYEHAG